jgi:hypothetical protein|tara:strand:- start:1428 stop:1616 length:189 start_codon:yes stop_codon:yes gene_type:complete
MGRTSRLKLISFAKTKTGRKGKVRIAFSFITETTIEKRNHWYNKFIPVTKQKKTDSLSTARL